MMASYSRVALIVLAVLGPAALAGPRGHHRKATPSAKDKVKDKDKDKVKDAGSDAATGSGTSAGSDTAPAEAVTASPDGTGTGAGSGSGMAPATTAVPPPETKDASEQEPDVDALRQEYLSLRDELFKSRARANAIASQLYSTRVTIKFTWTSGRYYGVSKASVRLDGASVYDDAGGAIAGDDGVRFDGYVAPGRHLITFHVEATGKDDDSFASTTESQVVVKAVAGKDLVVSAKAHDSGDIAYEWKRSEHGNYGLGIDVSVKTAKPAADEGAPAKGKK